MSAVHFVDSFRNQALQWLLGTFLWLLFFVLLSVAAWLWYKGLQEISTRWGNLALGLILLAVSGIFALLKAHVLVISIVHSLVG